MNYKNGNNEILRIREYLEGKLNWGLNMRYIIDLDGTICDLKEPNQSYSEVKPKNVKEALQEIVDRGDTVIIFTARHMKTCENNVELVEERIGKITRDWLNRYEIPYDQLILVNHMGTYILMI